MIGSISERLVTAHNRLVAVQNAEEGFDVGRVERLLPYVRTILRQVVEPLTDREGPFTDSSQVNTLLPLTGPCVNGNLAHASKHAPTAADHTRCA
jgi:hypothetical protein